MPTAHSCGRIQDNKRLHYDIRQVLGILGVGVRKNVVGHEHGGLVNGWPTWESLYKHSMNAL